MKKIIILLLFLLALPLRCFAINTPTIVINEVAWMGTKTSANDEWIELKNTTTSTVNLSGWVLKSSDQKLTIKLKGAIAPGGFHLLERTDDTSVPNIIANLIYTGALSNTGMDLLLYDGTENIIDQANCLGKWCAGDNTTKQTMEKTVNGGWQTSQSPEGTPNTENSLGAQKAILPVKTEAKTTKPTLPIKEISDNTNVKEATLADISQDAPAIPKSLAPSPGTTNNPWFLFFSTLGTVVILGTIITIIKYKKDVRS